MFTWLIYLSMSSVENSYSINMACPSLHNELLYHKNAIVMVIDLLQSDLFQRVKETPDNRGYERDKDDTRWLLEIWFTSWVLDCISVNGTCWMLFAIQCTWDGVPRGSGLLTHSSLSQNANDEVVLMEDSHHVAVTLAGEPFPVHLLVLVVSYISGHQGPLSPTLYHWGHPSVQSTTEIKYV